MALACEVGTFTSPTSTGNDTVTLTDTGLTPKVVLIMCTFQPSEGTASTGVQMLGMWEQNGGQCVTSWRDEDGTSEADCGTRFDGAKVIEFCNNAGTQQAWTVATVASAAAGSFTLNYTTAAFARQFCYLVLGGDDIDDTNMNVHQAPATASNVSHSVLSGLTAGEACCIGLLGRNASNPGGATHLFQSIGITDGTTQASLGVGSENTATSMNTQCRQTSGNFIDGLFDDAAWATADITFDGAGYDLNWTKVPAIQVYCGVLTIKGIRAYCKQTTTGTTSGAHTLSVEGAAAEPEGAFLITGGNSNTNIANDIRSGIGWGANASQQAFTGITQDDTNTTAVADRWTESDEVLMMLALNGASAVEEFNWGGTDAAGFDLNATTATTTAYNFATLMFIPAATAGGTEFPFQRYYGGAPSL